MESTLRFARAAASLPGVQLSVVSQDPPHKLPSDLRQELVDFEQVGDAMQSKELLRAVHRLQERRGRIGRLLGILEPLQEPLAEVREQLGIRGMDSRTARNFRDKAHMKELFGAAGIPCARHRLCATEDDALRFAQDVGYPLVGKPPAGAGARSAAPRRRASARRPGPARRRRSSRS